MSSKNLVLWRKWAVRLMSIINDLNYRYPNKGNRKLKIIQATNLHVNILLPI